MKRCFDIGVAGVLLIVLLPVMLVVAGLIAVSMGRPVLFRQQRPGLQAKPFMLYKFRTMAVQTDAAGRELSDELRMTGLGRVLRKLSLDELPQLINVLKGELSLVGPRPLLMEYLSLYSKEQARRHEVLPGMTGWAQVNGRNELSWEERFALDVWYVDNRSFRLDLKILWMTVVKVFRSEGVAKAGYATMPKFTGKTEGHEPHGGRHE